MVELAKRDFVIEVILSVVVDVLFASEYIVSLSRLRDPERVGAIASPKAPDKCRATSNRDRYHGPIPSEVSRGVGLNGACVMAVSALVGKSARKALARRRGGRVLLAVGGKDALGKFEGSHGRVE